MIIVENNVMGFIRRGYLQARGIGAYPWHCQDSVDHPERMVYDVYDQTGLIHRGTMVLEDYKECADGIWRSWSR